MCILCLNNPLVDWHGLDAPAIEPALAGTDAGGASNGASVGLNPALVNQLDSGAFWYTSSGTAAQTITYGFTTSNAFASGFGEAPGWSSFTEAQKATTRQVMTLWDDLIAPSLVEATGSPNTADIKFSNTTTDIGYAHAYFPGQVNSEATANSRVSGSVWLNPAYSSGTNNLVTPTPGVYGYMAILHEVGHSLGLDHGGIYNGGAPAYGNTSTGWLYAEDSHQYTVMSYFNASNTGASWGGKYAQTPMVYDIMAIQQMYGADYTTRAGNTVYGFNANAGNALYDFSQNATPILTIWDGNGSDTIDLSGWSSASTLNLTAGSYSSVNGMTKNLAIAYDVDIENANGGAGNDMITGNDLANTLMGNGGADTINGAGGNDIINGGAGVDILRGGLGDDTIYFDALDNLTLLDGGDGFDTLVQLDILVAFDLIGHNLERLLNIITDAGAADWAEQTDYYDFSGLLYERDVVYDNGTRSVTEFDVYDIVDWSELTTTYDANGVVIGEVYVPDAGAGSVLAITSNGAGPTAAISISGNAAAVTTVAANNPDTGTDLTYSIIGGADAGKFTINEATGALTFIAVPNFEAPADAGANNVYDVQVQASNGALSDTQNIAVTVTNQNEAPTITSNGGGETAAISIAEYSTAVTTVTASDPDVGATRTYAIIGGADAARFTINASTGVLSFIVAPTFGTPTDAGTNNVYDVQVQVSDGALTDTQTLAVTVTDVDEALIATTITGTSSGNTLTGTSGINIINGLGGNDRIAGLGGGDTLNGGSGTDTATYAASAAAVKVSLMTGLGSGGDAQGDSLVSIENLTGSNLNDVLEGNGSTNVLAGGSGFDTVSYENALAGVTVRLAKTSAQSTGGAGSDTLTGFENLTGSKFNDTLTGTSGNNVLMGLAGNDTLTGGGGSDTFDFSSLVDGRDIITDFTTGADRLDLIDLLDAAGLGSLDYATLTGQGHLLVQTGNYVTGTSTNSASSLDTAIYVDADGLGAGGSVLVAILEDRQITSSDFLV